MLKVLLVDDEYIVLKGMEAMLTDQKILAVQTFIAGDAVEALNIIEDIQPDVVIADINMPEIDGLQLIQLIRRKNVQCKFIICTGYDKIEYLHQAIKQQVTEYLLKPIDKNILLNKLKELEEEKERKLNEVLSLLKINLLHRQTGVPLLEPSELRLLLPKQIYYLWVLSFDSQEQTELLEKNFSTYFSQIIFLHKSRNTVLLTGIRQLPIAEIQKIGNLVLDKTSIRYGISSPISICGLKDFFPFDCRSFYEAVSNLILNILPLNSEERTVIQKVGIHPLWLWNPEEDTQTIELWSYLEILVKHLPSLTLTFAHIFCDFSANRFYPSSAIPTSQWFINRYLSASAEIKDMQSLYHIIIRLFSDDIPEITKDKNLTENFDKIDRAITYIQKYFQQDISLDSVAEYVSLHPSYLSYLFKKKTGESFLHYLHTIRLNTACQLMIERPDLSLERISQQVGYRTGTYFYKAFRQRFGTSPREWQKEQLSSNS